MECHAKARVRIETCLRVEDNMMQPKHIVPPQWPLKVLRFFVKKRYIEEIEGDMEELFYDNVEQLSH